MLEGYLEQLKEKYGLEERKDTGFERFKASVLNFTCRAYDSGELGHVSYMCASGLFGLMKMETLVVNPLDKDAPLFSIDLIKAMGSNSLYLEQYDTNLEEPRKEEGFAQIVAKNQNEIESDPKKYWYDDIRYRTSLILKKKPESLLQECLKDYFEEYLHILEEAPKCDRKKKQVKARTYSHGLLENGGPATDTFLKSWGKEKTEEFFDQVMFG
ncbi:MAG: hypothetical protein II529_03250 [Erysipelotrichaceae bacterium]|nr:hypothetical protein [Erysipelotrichaceae bacterium]